MLGDTAFGICRTWIAIGAGTATALINAGQSHRTFAVSPAFGLLIGRRICDHITEAITERIAH